MLMEGTSIETLVRNMRMADRVQVLFHRVQVKDVRLKCDHDSVI
jgi:hypothetical protein